MSNLASEQLPAGLQVHPLAETDRSWVASFVSDHWGAEIVVAHSTVYRPAELPGFLAIQAGARVGLITYHIDERGCEIVTLDSLQSGQGIGTALIDAVKEAARRAGCRRLWLITTNDNLAALRFYQKRGFRLVSVRAGAVDVSRKFKPEIPLIGLDGIPIRDEIELEIRLT